MVIRLLALPLALVAFHSSIHPLTPSVRAELKAGFWQPACPVPLSKLRVLTVVYQGFDNRPHTGQIIVNADAAAPLARVFGRLYELRFPIRHMRIADHYGPIRSQPADGDVSGAFECRPPRPSPCTRGKVPTGWSEHAYGEAVDLNPLENPYVGCGQVFSPATRPYLDRTRLRRGMITPAVVRAFRGIGWGWGGDWAGSTKDYPHFSATGH